ncbi:MAG: hypothetical protein CMP64_03305 [Flavobacteriales bacterium]|nr:hypothetical protein [Flavobacteriales bacterium]|tara:strand:- start:3466 stop:4005 length:540 start_codon:yes stop_codon:yes gene_type:complete
MILAANNNPIAFLFFIGYKNTTFEMMNGKILDVKIVKERIKHYCAVMDRCQYQVFIKLKSYGVSDELADEILIELIQNKYINEERFARSYCSGKFKIKRWGRIKIAFELSKLKVSKSCILLGMSEIDDADYNDVIKHLANKKMALSKNKNIYVRKKKVVDYLIRKGYESELAWSYVHKL